MNGNEMLLWYSTRDELNISCVYLSIYIYVQMYVLKGHIRCSTREEYTSFVCQTKTFSLINMVHSYLSFLYCIVSNMLHMSDEKMHTKMKERYTCIKFSVFVFFLMNAPWGKKKKNAQ